MAQWGQPQRTQRLAKGKLKGTRSSDHEGRRRGGGPSVATADCLTFSLCAPLLSLRLSPLRHGPLLRRVCGKNPSRIFGHRTATVHL